MPTQIYVISIRITRAICRYLHFIWDKVPGKEYLMMMMIMMMMCVYVCRNAVMPYRPI